ncbi:polysaccharide biosynthesis tyrosine autokinase [Chloroflexi bacterium TSY]|nr:polysaccharide biosynthesis tyrosine autokinase [Chloroflexi bacterium TSY]
MNDFVELRQVLSKIGQKWWLVLLCTLLMGAAGYLYSVRQTPVYQATTSLIVGQTIQDINVNRGDIETSYRVALTYADIARRQPVLHGTVETLGLSEHWQTLRKRTSVELIDETQLLEITVEASSPALAAVIADEVANQLILLSPTNLQGIESEENRRFREERLEKLQSKIEDAEKRLDQLQQTLPNNAPFEQILQRQNQSNALEQLIIGWEANYQNLLDSANANKSANYLAIVEPAQSSNTPVRPRTLINTVIAAILGTILSIGLIFLTKFIDDSLKPGHNIPQLLGTPVLGNIGRIDGDGERDRLLSNKNLYSQVAEEYRLLRSKIQFMTLDGPKSFLVISPRSNQGRSTTAANLGIVMAQAGFKTILVDADLRHPIQHRLFGITNEGGLCQLIRYPDLKPNIYLRRTRNLPNLWILNSGTLPSPVAERMGGNLPPSPSKLLGSPRMEELLAEFKNLADVVILDSPSALSTADAVVLSNSVDGVLLVLATSRSKRESALQALFNLHQAKANMLGLVFNQIGTHRVGFSHIIRLLTPWQQPKPTHAPNRRVAEVEPGPGERQPLHAET